MTTVFRINLENELSVEGVEGSIQLDKSCLDVVFKSKEKSEDESRIIFRYGNFEYEKEMGRLRGFLKEIGEFKYPNIRIKCNLTHHDAYESVVELIGDISAYIEDQRNLDDMCR